MDGRIQEIVDQILANRESAEYDTFLKGMVRAFQEVLQAKPALLDEMFEEDTNEV